jgi:competence protein ComEC
MSVSMLLTFQNDLRNSSRCYVSHLSNGMTMQLIIHESLQEKSKSIKTTAKVQQIQIASNNLKVKGKLLLYLQKSKKAASLRYGSILLTRKIPQTIVSAKNPGDFDNAKYQALRQVYHQLYLKDADYIILEKKDKSFLMSIVFYLRANVLEVLGNHFSDKKIRGIAEALLIGYKNNLDNELVQSYSNTGVVHIIAISGLHLGLIYFVLLWLFNRLPFIKKHKSIKSIAVLVCLWLFSLITGASASVLRSAVMFSCILFGNLMQKKSSIYNSLAASAFILLCYNPYFIFDVGFQLSYLAIIGIIRFQKPIQNLFTPQYYLYRKFNEMASITIAAQIMTFPICVFYFHQFPVFFLLTNMIAVPLSTFILFAEIGLIAFHKIVFVSNGLAFVVEKSIQLLNLIITKMDEFYFSSIKNIYSDAMTTLILYGLIIAIAILIFNRQKRYFKISLVLITMFSSIQAFAKYHNKHQRKIIIYNSPHHQAIEFLNGYHYFFVGDSSQIFKNTHQYYYVKSESRDIKEIVQFKPYIQYLNTSMVVVDSSYSFSNLTKKAKVDIVLISKNPKISICSLMNFIAPQKIVIDASNKKWRIQKWKKECDSLKITCHVTSEKGAFVYDLN